MKIDLLALVPDKKKNLKKIEKKIREKKSGIPDQVKIALQKILRECRKRYSRYGYTGYETLAEIVYRYFF